MIEYFRKYVPNFSETAEPLYVFLKKTNGQSNLSKSPRFWGETRQEASGQRHLCLVEPPILAYQDHNKEFILYVDASGKGLGAVLFQYQEGDLRVISYGSRTLTPAEKNYWELNELYITNLEIFLYYPPDFHIYTDNNPVTYIMSTGKLTATGQRWVNELEEFSFSLHYKPGKQNTNTDIIRCTSDQTHLKNIQSGTKTVPF